MRLRFVSCSIILAALTAMSCSKVATQSLDRAATEKELTQIELDWMDKGTKGDVEFVRRITADDFVHTYNGESETKSHYIDNWSRLVSGSGASDNIKVNLLGADAAVVTGRDTYKNARFQSSKDGKMTDLNGEVLWTDTFVRRNGVWQCVASHESSVPAKK